MPASTTNLVSNKTQNSHGLPPSSSFLFPFQFTFGVCILELRQRIRANWLPPRTRLAPLILQVKRSSEPWHDQTSQNR